MLQSHWEENLCSIALIQVESDGILVSTMESMSILRHRSAHWMNLNLNVIHHEMHGASSTLLIEEDSSGLSDTIVGVETGLIWQSEIRFEHASNIAESGDGMSDAFLVSLVGPSGHKALTSTAVETLTSSDSSVPGYFRLVVRQ